MAKGNIFQNLFGSLFNSNDPEAVKRRILKNIAKDLSKSKYHFYKNSSHEIDPSFPKFFYEIYKVMSPAQLMFENTTPNAIKTLVINTTLSEKQKENQAYFAQEYIEKLSRTVPIKELSEEIHNKFDEFAAEFDGTKVIKIDNLYTKLVLFSNFSKFDFYFLLKKFDSSMREHNFNLPPKFQMINGSYIVEDIKNFVAVAWCLPFDQDWDDMFKLLKALKGVEPIAPASWRKILNRIRGLKEKNILEMMIQLITQNPSYRDSYKMEEHHIVDDYIASTRKTIDDTLNDLQARQIAGKVDSLASQIFGTASVTPLRNYNETEGDIYERKSLGAFAYATPLSYLKLFLLEYTKKEIRELSDIVLVRGEWTNPALAKPMSEAFHQLLGVSESITALDDRLADNSDLGSKLKALLPRTERDKEARNIIQMILRDANNEAARCILLASKNLIIYAKNLKMALEDFVKLPKSELVMNWRDLDHFAEGNLKNMCIDVYKKIYMFVSLMQNFPVEIDEVE